ncbi:serine/threonine-protein phosphatase 6 regulatory ankyrin repeat subunit C-like isoform X2 [Mytilus californianus]|uniref:serine/threonine-protein phosphatase 6 regulatory ankyrin repeat subunit C-like isoform X2 n=1 Tax=Mytilus californianus TaxID=6549 RepID=UPI002245ECAD|nr:serine/threonine-protein phosphatase 6 regulatory ankyrin repeat subunit C-like isoform X2 [Mytilus californianus]
MDSEDIEVIYRRTADQLDVSSSSSNLTTLIKMGNINGVRKLLERGESPDGTKSQENPPLHESVYQDDIEICKLLITYNVDLNRRDKHLCTALHRAAIKRSFAIVKLLVISGADGNASSPSGFTPAMLACHSDDISVAEYLVNISTSKFDVVDKFGNNILHCFCANGKIEHFDTILSFIKKFVDKGISINALNYDGHMLLDFSYRFGITFAKELITIGADVTKYDDEGRNYLNRYLDLYLNADNYLKAFVKNGFGRIPKNVLRHLINEPDRAGKTAFMRVCAGMFNSADVIQMFCNAGADINAQNHLGESPLHLMSRDMWIPDKDAILYLLQQGANVNAVDIFGRSPIFKMRTSEIIQIFIDFKADLNVKDKCGRSPLMGLLVYENAEQLKILVKRGADCNLQDINGSSPLHYVAWYNSVPIAHVLLQSGADVNLQDQMGHNPCGLAKALGNLDVALVLTNDCMTKSLDADHGICRSRIMKEIKYDNNLIVENIISPPEDPNELTYNILQSSGIGKPSDAETTSVVKTVFDFVSRICDKIGITNSRFKVRGT